MYAEFLVISSIMPFNSQAEFHKSSPKLVCVVVVVVHLCVRLSGRAGTSLPFTHQLLSFCGHHCFVGLAGMDESSEWNNNGILFWWATGRHLLQKSGNLFRRVSTPVNSELSRRMYREGIASLDPLTPASYVDNFSPLTSPCLTGHPDSQDTNDTNSGCKIFVFHHIYVTNNWREIVVDQLTKIIISGLYDRATAVYSTLSGPSATALTAAEQLMHSFGSKFHVLDHQLNSTLYERSTLDQIRSHVSRDDRILYIHSKG